MLKHPSVMIRKIYHKIKQLTEYSIKQLTEYSYHKRVYRKYRDFTMIPEAIYIDNLASVSKVKNIPGIIVECGVWKGGMIAGIADILGSNRSYNSSVENRCRLV